MKQKLTKIMALGAAVVLAIMPMAPAMAAIPTADDTGTIAVENVNMDDPQAVVTAYRIVEPLYGEFGLLGYETVDGINIANIEAPTSEEVQAAVTTVLTNPEAFNPVVLTRDGTTASADVPAGLYLVIVTDADVTVYNPALVAVDYADAGDDESISNGSVDMTSSFNFGSYAYLKSSTPTMTKDILVDGELVDGDMVSAGGDESNPSTAADLITFQIQTTLPSYKTSGEGSVYTNPVFRIEDELDTTFAEITRLSVVDGEGAELEAGRDYALVGGVGTNGFTITFTEDYLLNHGNMAITIEYDTALTADAKVHFDPNLNTAKLIYSNDPSNDESFGEVEETTYHYTFDMELLKQDEEGQVLEGAEFTLYTGDPENLEAVGSVLSDADGRISFSGLDTGIYFVKETKAPAGYTLNDTLYRVTIEGVVDDAGNLTRYAITVEIQNDDGTWAIVGRKEYSKAPGEDIVIVQEEDAIVPNTKLGRLPSTGGAGIVAFTIAGISMFLGSAAVFAKSRKKED